jgi:flagellar FliL protein
MSEAKEKEGEKGAAEVAAPPKSRKKLLLIIGGVVLLLVAVGVPGAYLLLRGDGAELEELPADSAKHASHTTLEGAGSEPELEEGEQSLGAIVPLDTFLVNLSGGKYLRLQVQVEFEQLDVPRRFYSRLVPIRDSIVSLLSQQAAGQLEEHKGREKLRSAVRTQINDILRKEDVRKVYFTQFVIQ